MIVVLDSEHKRYENYKSNIYTKLLVWFVTKYHENEEKNENLLKTIVKNVVSKQSKFKNLNIDPKHE